jgi:O-antigen/teichoic acid export membrane protein
MLTGFVVTPILVRQLGSTNFGLWVLLGSLAGYIGLVEAGIGTATAKRVAECRATDDRKRLDEVLGTAFMMYMAIAAIVLLLAFGLQFFVGQMFQLPPDRVPIARWCLLALGLNQAIAFLFIIQSATLYGSGRLDLMSGFGVAVATTGAIAQATVVLAGLGLPGLAVVLIATTITNGLVARRVIARYLPGTVVRPRAATGRMARELLKYGSRNSVVGISCTLAYGADALIIGFLLPVANVAHYAVALRLINLVRALAGKLTDVLCPLMPTRTRCAIRSASRACLARAWPWH